jgi:hypothetical protein
MKKCITCHWLCFVYECFTTFYCNGLSSNIVILFVALAMLVTLTAQYVVPYSVKTPVLIFSLQNLVIRYSTHICISEGAMVWVFGDKGL